MPSCDRLQCQLNIEYANNIFHALLAKITNEFRTIKKSISTFTHTNFVMEKMQQWVTKHDSVNLKRKSRAKKNMWQSSPENNSRRENN